jgi:flagellar assembly protein FliH
LEVQVRNLSNQFKPSSTFVDLDNSEEENKDKTRLFELSEFLGAALNQDRSFSFDSETARNFDIDNVKKAKQGVKELVADAVAKAKSLAIEIKENAYKEGHKTGYEEGFQTAYKEGENSAKGEFIPLLQTINSLVQELSEFRTMMYPKVEKEMIEMVTGLTKKILQHEINTNEDSVKQMILLAINSVIDKENMVIRIHPSDKAHAEAFYPELKNLFSEIKNITFEEHSGIEKGGCMIDTNFGTIDARIDQLEGQIDKILKLTPAVPVVSSSSKPLSEKSLETETKASDESTGSETPASETETKAGDESTGSETPASETETKASDESAGSETPASETETKASDESTGSETPASETEIKASDESTGSETPASETETKASDESTGSETPASEKSPKDTPEKED